MDDFFPGILVGLGIGLFVMVFCAVVPLAQENKGLEKDNKEYKRVVQQYKHDEEVNKISNCVVVGGKWVSDKCVK